MKFRQLLVVLASLLLITPLLLSVNLSNPAEAQSEPDVYVGIDLGYGVNVQKAKDAIDRVSSFTNFFVLGTFSLSRNLTQLNETLQYAYDKGMYFMSYPPTLAIDAGLINASKDWLNYIKSNWGNRLVGFLYPWEDEPGGHQLDRANEGDDYYPVENMNATDYADAENQFLNSEWFAYLNRAKKVLGYPLFTSDYALYWFDYKGGYDGLFAEFGWNYSTQINVALCRGAATVQNKQWGVVITYTYTHPPYMEPAADLYKDMIYAYDNGAKYIIVLDTNEDWSGGCLTEEHFQAIRDFWEYIKNNPRKQYPVTERIAYKLPPSYGCGFRGPLDKLMALGKIWGVWEADMTYFMISTSVGIMLEKYGSKLDIIYEETEQPNRTYDYSKIIRWDDPEAVADEWPTFPPWPGLTPEPTPTSDPTNSPTAEALPTQSPDQKWLAVDEYLWVAIVGTAVACFGVAWFVYRRKSVSKRTN